VNSIIDAFRKHLPDIIRKFNEGKELFNTPAEKRFIDKSFRSAGTSPSTTGYWRKPITFT